MANAEKVILGIDPGYADTGFGVIAKNGNSIRSLEHGSIQTNKHIDFSQRLQQVFEAVSRLVKKYQPDSVAIEKLYFSKNVKTALDVGQARGVVLLALYQSGQQVIEMTPGQVKQALTSSGSASKQQVGLMVKKILGLDKVPQPDDAADALAIAIAASFINPKLVRR